MTADDRQTERRTERTGPFPGPQARDRPWEAGETKHGPFERRRAGDRRAFEAPSDGGSADGVPERRRRWGRRKSDVLTTEARDALSTRGQALIRRFREPIIGLTLAGVAAPLINAGLNPGRAGSSRTGGEKTDAERATETPVPADRDLEGEVGTYWAEAEDDVVRAHTIEGAMVRYGIRRPLAEKIYDAASRHEIEPDVAFGLVFTESSFRNHVVSHVGARGLTQLMPRTARWLDPTITVRDLTNPDRNLDLGFRYLRTLIDKYDGDVENALTAYNRGPGTVDKILRRGGNPDNGYAGKVLAG